MIVELEGKKYETGKVSPSVIKKVAEAQNIMQGASNSVDGSIQAIEALTSLIALMLISGTQKIPYRSITREQIDDFRPIIEDNLDFNELVGIFTQIVSEITEALPNEGKPIAGQHGTI